jgi:hypothetical protein
MVAPYYQLSHTLPSAFGNLNGQNSLNVQPVGIFIKADMA